MFGRRHAKAITLIETLVAAGVVGVLLAILIPALWRARESGAHASAMADQRQRGVVLTQYTDAHQGRFPFYGIAGTNRGPLYDPSGELVLDAYWSQPACWGLYLEWTGQVSGLWPRTQRFDDPLYFEAPEDHLTYGAYAPARFWRVDSAQREADHQAQRSTFVMHPSRKVLLLRGGLDGPEARALRRLVWFADGHGALVRDGDLRPAMPLRFWNPGGTRGLTTEDGLEGRDL